MAQKNNIARLHKDEEVPSQSLSAGQNAALTVDVIRDDARFAALQEQWNSLVESSTATIYQTHEWLSLWWKHFRSPECSLRILVVRQNSVPIAIAPFYLEARQFLGFRICRQLKLMGSCVASAHFLGRYAEDGPSDYLDIIVGKANARVAAQAILQYLRDHGHLYDEIDFSNVPETSPLVTMVFPEIEAGEHQCTIQRRQACPHMDVPNSLDDFLKGLPSSVRRKFQQARNKFWREPTYAIQPVQQSMDLESAFRDLVALHQLRWNGAGYVGLFSDKRFEQFQRDVAQAFLGRGWLWFKAATVGGVRIAARLGFRFNGRYYDYLSGFDDRTPWAKSRPGFALLLSLIEDAIAERYQTVDFLRGNEQYKFDLTSTVAYNWSVQAVSNEYNGTIWHRLSRLLFGMQNLFHRGSREWHIIRIHLVQHGFAFFISPYAQFVLSRLKEKVNGILKKQKTVATKEETPGVTVTAKNQQPTIAQQTELQPKEAGEPSLSGSRTAGQAVSYDKTKSGQLSLQREMHLNHVRAMWLARIYLRGCTRVGERATTRARPFIENAGRMVIGKEFQLDSHVIRSALITGNAGMLEIGDFVTIDSGCFIKSLKSIRIGNRVRVGAHVLINDASGQAPAIVGQEAVPESIVIEDDVTLGDRVTIVKGVTVGKGSYVMPGSLVLGNIPSGAIAGGMPARVLAYYQPAAPEESLVH